MKKHLFFLSLCLLLVACSITKSQATTVTVSYNTVDNTANLQAALDNVAADTIVIPYTGSPWTTGPLRLSRSNVTLRLEPNVELVAKSGAFPRGSTCLLQIYLCSNITVTGYGATLRMLNGTDAAYTVGESRHALALRGVDNVLVEGLTCTKAGGDGIYVADGWSASDPTYSSNVTIQDCVLDDNRRQGISVISAKNLLIQRCVLSNTGVTSGTDPMAGIDFEPDNPTQQITNCVVRDCSFFGNNAATYSSGLHTFLGYLDATSQPVSLSIERCHFTSERTNGTAVSLQGSNLDGPQTSLFMTDCLIENTRGIGLSIRSGTTNTTVQVTRTVLRNTHTDAPSWGGTPIYLEGQSTDINSYGNITFTDCLIVDDRARPFMRSYEDRTYLTPPLAPTFCNGLHGNITVVNPNVEGHTWLLDDSSNDLNLDLNVTALTAMPQQTVALASVVPTTNEGVGTASFAVTRAASNTTFPLAVGLDWSGSASNRLDYGYRPAFAMLPPFATTVASSVAARADSVIEGDETVVATLRARSSAYDIGSPNANTLYISDDTEIPILAASVFSSSQINLSWTDSLANETGFKIERSANGSTGWTQIATLAANTTSYADTGLASATPYYYRVRATKTFGNSALSNTANATTSSAPIPIPNAPNNLIATAASRTQINLRWADNSSNESGFVVQRSLDGINWSQIATTTVNATTYTSTGLTRNRLYYYRVRAVNNGVNSAFSNTASIKTLR